MKNVKKFNEIYYYDGRSETEGITPQRIRETIENGTIKTPDEESKREIFNFLENIDEDRFKLTKYNAKNLDFDLFYFNDPKLKTLWLISKDNYVLAAKIHDSFTMWGAYKETSPMIAYLDWVSFSSKGDYPGTWNSWIFFIRTKKWVDPSVG